MESRKRENVVWPNVDLYRAKALYGYFFAIYKPQHPHQMWDMCQMLNIWHISHTKPNFSPFRASALKNATLFYFTISKSYFINYTIPFYNTSYIQKIYYFTFSLKYYFFNLSLLFLLHHHFFSTKGGIKYIYIFFSIVLQYNSKFKIVLQYY